jgi:hypothetical protein
MVGDGKRSAHVNAAVTQRDRNGLDRVASFFSYGSLAGLMSGLASGGLIRRVQQLALHEFMGESRVQMANLRRDLDAARQQGLSAKAESDAANAKAL